MFGGSHGTAGVPCLRHTVVFRAEFILHPPRAAPLSGLEGEWSRKGSMLTDSVRRDRSRVVQYPGYCSNVINLGTAMQCASQCSTVSVFVRLRFCSVSWPEQQTLGRPSWTLVDPQNTTSLTTELPGVSCVACVPRALIPREPVNLSSKQIARPTPARHQICLRVFDSCRSNCFVRLHTAILGVNNPPPIGPPAT